MDLLDAARQEAERIFDAIVADAAPEAGRPPSETPPDRAMGDVGMPCFPLAKALRKAPVQIAADLAAAAQHHIAPEGWIVEARAVGPYVNLFFARERIAAEVLADPDAAMRNAPTGKRILIEHTSANPNGPLHVGRARNPILGDTLARILRGAGHDVESQYYMDNLGRQVAQLYWGKQHVDEAELEPLPAGRDKADHDLVRYYQAANARRESDPEAAEDIKRLVAELEEAPADLLADVRTVYEACFEGMRASLTRLGVTYDSIKDESDLVMSGAVEDVITRLKATDRARVEDDGANYLDMSAELEGNKSTKFFFTRRDGTSVYATRDVAYHAWKAEHVGAQPDGSGGRLVNILGEDHRLQSLQVGIALEALGVPRPDVTFYAFVSLPEGKMSTRANRVVFLDDLMDEAVDRAYEAVKQRRGAEMDEAQLREIAEAVGIAALRFNIARVQPEKPIKFRWEDALDFEGDSAPYLLYAYARAASLLRKAADAGLETTADAAPIGEGEHRLLLGIAGIPGAIRDAAEQGAPHRVCATALELAAAFNEYYRDHPVIECEDAGAQHARLQTVAAAKDALAFLIETLGLPRLESM